MTKLLIIVVGIVVCYLSLKIILFIFGLIILSLSRIKYELDDDKIRKLIEFAYSDTRFGLSRGCKLIHNNIKEEIILSRHPTINSLVQSPANDHGLYYFRMIFFIALALFSLCISGKYAVIEVLLFAGLLYCAYCYYYKIGIILLIYLVTCSLFGSDYGIIQTLFFLFFLYRIYLCYYKFAYRHLYIEVLQYFKQYGKDFIEVNYDERKTMLTSGLLSYLTLKKQRQQNAKKT